MTVPARMGIVTLGVSDLARSIAFYEALGWERCASSVEGVICWFRTADSYLGLFPYEELAADAAVASPRRGTFDGITLAINVETESDVGAALDAAAAAGATILKPATDLGSPFPDTSPIPTATPGRWPTTPRFRWTNGDG